MPTTKPLFPSVKIETLLQKCIVFPADGSETRLVPMVNRNVTEKDIPSLVAGYSRCVDMSSTYDGCDYRKMRVPLRGTSLDGVLIGYLFFYNLSPNLPININIANLIGVTPDYLKKRKRLFWRGDVVAMKFRYLSQSDGHNSIVESLDADLLEFRCAEKIMRDKYHEGVLEHLLYNEEEDFKTSASSLKLTSIEKQLRDLNELRCTIGQPPLSRHAYMKSSYEQAAFHQNQKVKGPPILPLELEREIFEMCALQSPNVCKVLVLVAKKVYEWVDLILMSTVNVTLYDRTVDDDFRLKCLHAKLTKCGPVGHNMHKTRNSIKNLSITGQFFFRNQEIDSILALCPHVTNLLLLTSTYNIKFFENPQAGPNLRRLTIRLSDFFRPINFYHPCFASLTHLHLYDKEADWLEYDGWETKINLTHLAFAHAYRLPEGTMHWQQLMQKLPSIKYLALGRYNEERDKYTDVCIDYEIDRPFMIAQNGVSMRVVSFYRIPPSDWERGARGESDFWDDMEQLDEKEF